MQCRSKNITCAFLVTAHIVHKAVVVSLRKIFWQNGFIIFITGKSNTKLHVTLFLDLSPSISFKLDPMDKGNTYTRPSLYKWGEILHFFGAFFSMQNTNANIFLWHQYFFLTVCYTILVSFAWRICIASTTIPQLIFHFILITCLLDIVFILYREIIFQSPVGVNVIRYFQHHGQSQRQQLSLIIYPSKFLCTYHDHNDHKQHKEVHDKCLQKKQIHKKSEHEQSNLLIMSCMNILI